MKRILALTLALALFAGAGLPAAAAPTVYFSAVDYRILPLDDPYMPVSLGGKLCAPVAVFTAPETGIFSSVYDGGRFVTLMGPGNKVLNFDLATGVASDDKVTFQFKAVQLNGLYYLPVANVCDHFNMTFGQLETDYGPLLRLRVKSTSSTDQQFLNAARDTLTGMYNGYVGTPPPPTASTPPAAQTTSPAAVPSNAPSPSAPASPSPSPTPARPIAYLTFDDGPTLKNTGPILDILDRYGVRATFFILGSNMQNNEPAVRRMFASGHAVGLHGWTHDVNQVYASPSALVAELERANDKLEELTMYRSRLVRVPYGSTDKRFTEAMCQAMTDAGYRFWDWNVDGDRSSRKTAGEISSGVISDLEKHDFDGPAIILLHERSLTVEALPAILDYMTGKGYIFDVCTESERPVNRWNWIQ